MNHAELWYAVAVPCCAFALFRGGQPERVVGAMVILASAATGLLAGPIAIAFRSVVWPLVGIDVLVLAALLFVMLWADRYWPLYFAVIHTLSVALHGVRALDPELLPMLYARIGGLLGYPTLAILVIGTWRHDRRGHETDWSWQVGRAATAGGDHLAARDGARRLIQGGGQRR